MDPINKIPYYDLNVNSRAKRVIGSLKYSYLKNFAHTNNAESLDFMTILNNASPVL